MKVSIIGQGYVGLTISAFAAKHHQVIGFDLNSNSILKALESILTNYDEISSKALYDFNNTFNCNQFYNASFKHLFPIKN